MSNHTKKILLIGLIASFSLLTIAITILQVRKQQEIRSRASGGSVTLTLNPETINKSVGETFSADVFLNNSGFDISGVNIIIKFDNPLLEVIDFQPTGSFSKIANTPNNQIGTLQYYASNMSTDKINDNLIKIGTINFKAKAPGTATVGFQKTEISASGQRAFLTTGNHTTASFIVTQNVGDPTSTPTPTQTPTQPTATPGPTHIDPSPIPTQTPIPTEMPTPTFVPTPTLTPNGARLSLSLALWGLGSGVGSNPDPKIKQKKATVCIYPTTTDTTGDNKCERGKKAEGYIEFSNASKKFDVAVFDLGVIQEGDYEIFVKVDKYLRKRIPGAKHLKADVTTPIQETQLKSGDITGDNTIDIQDYNAYVGCFGEKFNTASCQYKEAIDLNDDLKHDSTVDFSDYKIFIQNITTREGD